jgi:hypothetical protein
VRARTRRLRALAAFALISLVTASAASISEIRRDGLHLKLQSLGYDKVVSFYLGRGLPASSIERYAKNCVLLAALRNDRARGAVSSNLRDWLVLVPGQPPRHVEGRSSWVAELERARPSEEARMAFEWSQLPEVVNLDPGDSVQGMVSLPVKRGVDFELVIHWKSGDRIHEERIRRIGCN